MNIDLEDAIVAAGTLRDMARASVRLALDKRSGRHQRRHTWFTRNVLKSAKQQGMAARRIQAAVNAEIKRLTQP